jgi:signal transduction histidine kinase
MHYAASLKAVFWHEIFQRAYYLPIVVAALWYGLRGGVLSAGLASVAYLPHVILSWHGFPTYQFNQYAEVVLFFAFGTLTGVLADQQRKQKARLQETAQRLSEVHADLQKSFESLRRAERLSALGTLSAGLAHEIRNPLSAIQGALEIMGRDDLEPERRREFMGIVTRELTHLNEMLAHFLHFARPQPPERKATAVRQLMQEVHSLVSEPAASRRVQVRLRNADFPLTMVSLDPHQIKEVMLNLVLNATEAMPTGGTVELSAAKEGDGILINVTDDGIGVPEGDLQRIFDPFYSTKPEGTGLGLPIAHQIMEQHGGRIEAKRNPGRGMTFSLVFPLAAETESKVSR